ncbi:MAG: hypothetical protein Ct9H300mP4_17330 [Gammaproteobacteria bacterium]|nr:MAG: hypothetical protein Ct9H300mP4_17330 [Gammaproteobacteria bacterium]
MVHTYIKGTIFGITPDQGEKPMIGYNILIKTFGSLGQIIAFFARSIVMVFL